MSNLWEQEHGTLIKAGEIFMKGQHDFHSCISGLGDPPQVESESNFTEYPCGTFF